MTPLQLELIRLLWSKDLTFWCRIARWTLNAIIVGIDLDMNMVSVSVNSRYHNWWKIDDIEIIWHPATLSDLHRWMNKNGNLIIWSQWNSGISYNYWNNSNSPDISIKYDSSKDLLDQEPDTLKQLAEFIKSNQ